MWLLHDYLSRLCGFAARYQSLFVWVGDARDLNDVRADARLKRIDDGVFFEVAIRVK